MTSLLPPGIKGLKPSLHIYHEDFRVLYLLVIQEESEVSADVKVTNESNKNCPEGVNEIEEKKLMAMIRKAMMMTMIMMMMM